MRTLILAASLLLASPAIAAPSLAAKTYRDEGARLLEAKRYREAIGALQTALEHDKTYAEAWVDLGNARLALGEYNEAARAFESALSQNSDLPIAQYNLAYALRRAGQMDRAAEAYRVYLSRNPGDADAHYGLAETLRANGDDAAAAEAYEKYATTEQRPDRQAWVEKARQLAAELRASGGAAPVPAAAAPAAAAAAAAPTTAAGVAPTRHLSFSELKAQNGSRPEEFRRGLNKLRTGDYEGALVDLERAATATPKDPLVLAALAGAQLGVLEADKAIETYRRALNVATKESAPAIRFGLGEALRARGDDDAAKVAYKQVLDEKSTTPQLKKLAEQRLGVTK